VTTRRRLLGSLAALALVGGPAAAAQDTGAAPPAAAETAPVIADQDKVVCRSVRKAGTRMATRVCETKGQQEERLKAARDRQVKMDTQGARASTCTRSGGRGGCGAGPRF
jgi:hypothetical protein